MRNAPDKHAESDCSSRHPSAQDEWPRGKSTLRYDIDARANKRIDKPLTQFGGAERHAALVPRNTGSPSAWASLCIRNRRGKRMLWRDLRLQYDHVLPVALGGATTVENLQLLCADCNRRKSDSL